MPFAYDLDKVSVKAPIKYPWNLLNLAANYKAHAEGMGQAGAGRAAASFDAAAAANIDPDRDGPVVFPKSPRSALMSSTSPRSIRSAALAERGATTRFVPRPTIPAVPMRSDRPKAAMTSR